MRLFCSFLSLFAFAAERFLVGTYGSNGAGWCESGAGAFGTSVQEVGENVVEAGHLADDVSMPFAELAS